MRYIILGIIVLSQEMARHGVQC